MATHPFWDNTWSPDDAALTDAEREELAHLALASFDTMRQTKLWDAVERIVAEKVDAALAEHGIRPAAAIERAADQADAPLRAVA